MNVNNTEHMTSHNNKIPKKREKYRGQMSSDISFPVASKGRVEEEYDALRTAPKITDLTASLNELDVLTVGPKPPKYLREIQNRRNQPSLLNMDSRYVRNVSIGVGLRQVGPHCALYVPIVRYHPYSNGSVTNKREERPRTRSENNDEIMAGPSTSHQLVRNDEYSVEELSTDISVNGMKKSKSLENIIVEDGVNFDQDRKPEVEMVSDCIERLKVD